MPVFSSVSLNFSSSAISIDRIDLSENAISGAIPSEFGQLRQMSTLSALLLMLADWLSSLIKHLTNFSHLSSRTFTFAKQQALRQPSS